MSPVLADFVAKLDEEQLAGNNRIRTNNILNQHCVLEPDLESILLARALKIVLQQYRHIPEVPPAVNEGRLRFQSGLCRVVRV